LRVAVAGVAGATGDLAWRTGAIIEVSLVDASFDAVNLLIGVYEFESERRAMS
jgi:hypothetical protein